MGRYRYIHRKPGKNSRKMTTEEREAITQANRIRKAQKKLERNSYES